MERERGLGRRERERNRTGEREKEEVGKEEGGKKREEEELERSKQRRKRGEKMKGRQREREGGGEIDRGSEGEMPYLPVKINLVLDSDSGIQMRPFTHSPTVHLFFLSPQPQPQIGRASCRERV